MEQRRLRLGDILDDYCPRERRVTNHAIVAMVEEDVKQTRCTTCDAEHAYKGGKAPRRRKKETPATLYKEVLEGMPDAEGANLLNAPPAVVDTVEPEPTSNPIESTHAGSSVPEAVPTDQAPDQRTVEAEAPAAHAVASEVETKTPVEDAEPLVAAEDGPVHRPLIRATLPRPEGQKDARPLPEFTIRHAPGRNNGNFRGGDQRMKARGGQGTNGGRSGQRFAVSRPGGSGRGLPGRGQGSAGGGGGFRASQPSRRGGKKRSR
jgi:hypothetical protein